MKRMIWNTNLGLVGKITWAITLILIIPVAALCFYYYVTFQNSLINEAENKLEENLNNLERTMDDNLSSIEAVMNGLVYRQEFSYFLDGNNHLTDKEISYYVSSVQNEMVDIRSLYPSLFYQILIYSDNTQAQEELWAKDWQVELKALTDQEYFSEIENIALPEKLNTATDIYYGDIREAEFIMADLARKKLTADVEQPGTLIMPAYLKIYNITTREFIGVIEIDMEISKLIKESELDYQGNKEDYIILNGEKGLIYGNSFYKKADFISRDFAEDKGSFDVDIEGGTYMMVYSRCQNTGLIRVVSMSKEDVLRVASQMIETVVAVAVLAIAIIMIFSYWLIKRMLKRLLVLDKMMGKIEQGDFNVTIPEGKKNDELSRIERRFNHMSAQLQEMIHTAVTKEKSQKDAELRALQAQINPHFLYNTLENMRMQCEIEGYDVITDSLTALGDLFRYSVKWGSYEVPFEMEWQNLKNYISIMEMRFEDQLKCTMECGDKVDDIIMPKMILQPLVENCFEHAFKEVLPPWVLHIKVYREDNLLVISICDNGKGMEKERLCEIRECLEERRPLEKRKGTGVSIGIINVMQRINMVCLEGSRIEIDSTPGEGTNIFVKIVLGD